MQDFTKAAYAAGVQQALVDFGLAKEARDYQLDYDASDLFNVSGGTDSGAKRKAKGRVVYQDVASQPQMQEDYDASDLFNVSGGTDSGAKRKSVPGGQVEYTKSPTLGLVGKALSEVSARSNRLAGAASAGQQAVDRGGSPLPKPKPKQLPKVNPRG